MTRRLLTLIELRINIVQRRQSDWQCITVMLPYVNTYNTSLLAASPVPSYYWRGYSSRIRLSVCLSVPRCALQLKTKMFYNVLWISPLHSWPWKVKIARSKSVTWNNEVVIVIVTVPPMVYFLQQLGSSNLACQVLGRRIKMSTRRRQQSKNIEL